MGKVHVWAEGIRLVKGAGPLLFTEVFGIGCLIFSYFPGTAVTPSDPPAGSESRKRQKVELGR